ncbi:tRNA dihydrouridine synthase [Planctomycetota bacterium]
MLKLGDIELNVPFFQASLSGYSDYAMRRLALDFGAPLTFAGVILAKSAAHPKVLAKPAFRPHDDEHPVGAQIMGETPPVMAKAAKALVGAGYDLIDLNFACPAPKVLRRGRGGHLLKEPQRVIEIFKAVRDAVECPVLMKLRLGFDNTPESRNNIRQIVSAVSSTGVDALVIHGRSVKQYYRGCADWRALAELKRDFPQTTIIGSGDIFEAESAVKLLKDSGLDGLLIARGAIGNPWIYCHLRAVLEGQVKPPLPDVTEQGRVMLRHFQGISEIYAARKAVGYFRKFAVNYCSLHPSRKKAQQTLLSAETPEELLLAIKQWYNVS